MKKNKRRHIKASLVWLIVGGFSALTAVVYECFSHGVMSAAMITMPLWPLVGGAGAFYLFDRMRLYHRAGGWPRMLWHCAVATGQWGSFIAGVKRIYGVRNPYGIVFFVLADVLFVSAAVLYLSGSDQPQKE